MNMADPVKKTDNEMLSEKLDKIGTHLDSLHARVDAWDEEKKADKARLDALCTSAEKADKARVDAEEAKKNEDETRADAARAVTATEADRAKFADAQMRCDAAYQAWSKQAPHALHGETLRDFRIRLLNPLKQHSKVYKDSALALIGDDAAFSVIEEAIINDAITASNTSFNPMAPLRKVVSRMDSGHIATKWIGDPRVGWSEFSGGATKFGRINASVANRGR
jgi:hypothetical protein